MILSLVVLTCSRLGLGEAPRKMLLNTLEQTVHRIRTVHMDLTRTYQAYILTILFGTGQGSGGSPHFWIAVLEVILSCIDKELEGLK